MRINTITPNASAQNVGQRAKPSPTRSVYPEVSELPETESTLRISGFGPMTRIRTSFGEFPAQALRQRDMVRTRSGDFKEILWIDRIVLGEDFVRYHTSVLPIVLRAGSLAPNIPRKDIALAPFQAISRGQNFVGNPPRRAIDALRRPLVYRKPENMITYTVFHCGEPVSVECEGLWIDVMPEVAI